MDSAIPDPDLKNVIDKLAQFVARNGAEFESMTKQKQRDNPNFGFLFGGPYFNYYQFRVTTEQAILRQRGQNVHQPLATHSPMPPAVGNIPRQPSAMEPMFAQRQIEDVEEKIRESHRNLAAQHQVLTLQMPSEGSFARYRALELQHNDYVSHQAQIIQSLRQQQIATSMALPVSSAPPSIPVSSHGIDFNRSPLSSFPPHMSQRNPFPPGMNSGPPISMPGLHFPGPPVPRFPSHSQGQMPLPFPPNSPIPFRMEGPPLNMPPVQGNRFPGHQPTAGPVSVSQLPPPRESQPEVPYFDLPAGLMVPLVGLGDTDYKSIDPNDIRLPAPTPPSERLLRAVEMFYLPPSHDSPRNSEGWEQLGLFEFYKRKAQATKSSSHRSESDSHDEDDDDVRKRSHSRNSSRTKTKSSKKRSTSRSPKRRYREESSPVRRRRGSTSSSRSRSPSPPRRRSRRRSRSRSRSRTRSPRRQSRKRSRSISPLPSMASGSKSSSKLDTSNKGHQLLKKMGWQGCGLGAKEQGIQEPISGGEVRDQQDMYKGVGLSSGPADVYEAYRRNRGQKFMDRITGKVERK
ncbi:Calcium homeostasis endoplasmic reticulum protein [Halotydeus destructor]|nr:Calcium homeostasis endoplasmic reticulum protein [Halotydeus destructor]